MKILIVDDSKDIRIQLRYVVEHNGHQAIEAENGQQALELAMAQQPDLIISDVLMPLMDGFRLLEQIRGDESLRTIPFIFYSATYTEAQDQQLAASLGADGYIIKPENPTRLWQDIERILDDCSRKHSSPAAISGEERSYLRQYGKIVAEKLEHKVRQLEHALSEKELLTQQLSKAQRDWERTFEAIGDITTLLDPEFHIVRINHQGCQTFNAKPEELVGRRCYQVFRGCAEPCDGCPLLQSVDDLAIHTAEIPHETMGKTFLVTASPILGADGTVERIIHFAKDITAQKEMEKHLRQAQKLEAIGTLAGGITHDFNNILTAILGFAELAKFEMPAESPAGAHLDQVLQASHRATALVRQILTFCRQTEHKCEAVEPHSIIKEALKMLRSSIPTTIAIHDDINPQCGTLLADPSHLHQIIMNLCTNAYHTMRETGGTMAISLQPVYVDHDDAEVLKEEIPPGPYVVLEVSDTGYGMEKKILAKIFDPYFTTKKMGEGTGLGLSVVHGIVTSYGGAISVSSEPGKGTSFRVYLPRTVDKTAPEPVSESGPLLGGTERLLVVDDEEDIVAVERTILQGLGYRVTTETSSSQALRTLQDNPQAFDLLLTDMTMPELNGIELCERVRAIRPTLPVILCTGFSELINEEKAKGLGIQAYIMKPFTRRELTTKIRTVLDGGSSG